MAVPSAKLALTGVALGLILYALLAASGWLSSPAPPPAAPSARIVSECDGAIDALVIQYVRGADFALATYKSFLPQLPRAVTVYAACPDASAFEALRAAVGPTACDLRPLLTGHPITAWSRDRWAALTGSGRTFLLCPREEAAAAQWPARAGDQQIAFTLARLLPASPTLTPLRSDLAFDAGDFLADDEAVFVTPAVFQRSRGLASPDHLRRTLSPLLNRRVVLLERAPDHHAGMFMMAAGGRRMIVGDPSLARPLLESITPTPELPFLPDFSPSTQELFDSVARQAAAEGYTVTRIPVLPGQGSRSWLTWVNGLIDHRDGRRHFYMPTYAHAEPLNHAAEQVWQSLGYEVHRIDCTTLYPHFGTLHCLVNVLSRK
jgi:hypothetical protein